MDLHQESETIQGSSETTRARRISERLLEAARTTFAGRKTELTMLSSAIQSSNSKVGAPTC